MFIDVAGGETYDLSMLMVPELRDGDGELEDNVDDWEDHLDAIGWWEYEFALPITRPLRKATSRRS